MTNVGTAYWQSRDQAKLTLNIEAAKKQEAARQDLMANIASKRALVYARFLVAVENDATFGHGSFRGFMTDDDDVFRQWPFLQIKPPRREVRS